LKCFIPQVPRTKYEETYEEIAKSVKEQMRTSITPRRIYSLDYVHDKKRCHAEVGMVDPQQGRYEVVAIFESKPYIVYTRSANGSHGLTILVSGDEITTIKDFD
jgi:hypothetical protein